MEREKVKQWMWLIAYSIGLCIIGVNSGFIGKELVRFLKQLWPILGGIVIAFLLNHPYEWIRRFFMEKLHMPKKCAAGAALSGVYLLAFGLAAALFRLVLPNLIENIQMLFMHTDQYLEDAGQLIEKVLGWFHVKNISAAQIVETMRNIGSRIGESIGDLTPKIAQMSGHLLAFGASFAIAVALSAYMLGSKQRLISQAARLARAYIPVRLYGKVYYFMSTVYKAFDNYISSQVLEAGILGGLCSAGMFILRLDYAGLVGVIVAVTALVPIFGAYAGGAISFLLLVFISVKKAVIFIIFFVILQQFENNVIYPRVVGRRIGLPGLWILAGVTIGGGYFGFVGVLLAVPVVTIVYTLVRNDVRSREEKGCDRHGKAEEKAESRMGE